MMIIFFSTSECWWWVWLVTCYNPKVFSSRNCCIACHSSVCSCSWLFLHKRKSLCYSCIWVFFQSISSDCSFRMWILSFCVTQPICNCNKHSFTTHGIGQYTSKTSFQTDSKTLIKELLIPFFTPLSESAIQSVFPKPAHVESLRRNESGEWKCSENVGGGSIHVFLF